MEREEFVFTACNSILFFPGVVERSSTGCHVAHTKAQVCRRVAGAEQGSCLVGFPPSPQPALGLTKWQTDLWLLDPAGLQWDESPQPFTAPFLVCVNSGPASQETQVGSCFQTGFLNDFIVLKQDDSSLSLFSQG